MNLALIFSLAFFAQAVFAADFNCTSKEGPAVRVGISPRNYIQNEGEIFPAHILKLDADLKAEIGMLCPHVDLSKIPLGSFLVQNAAPDDSSFSILLNGANSLSLAANHCSALSCQ